MSRRGSIGIISLAIVAALLLVVQGIYKLIAADYNHVRTHLRQEQCLRSVASSLQALERVGERPEDFSAGFEEALPPGDKLTMELRIVRKGALRWRSARGENADVQVHLVSGEVSLPDAESVLHSHPWVSKVFRIGEQVEIAPGEMLNYTQVGSGEFLSYQIADYGLYARSMPDGESWAAGLEQCVFYDSYGGSLYLPAGKTITGNAVLANTGAIFVGERSKYLGKIHLISQGNIVVGVGARMENALLVSGGAVKISAGSYVRGRIYARQGLVVENGAVIQALPCEALAFKTDTYLPQLNP